MDHKDLLGIRSDKHMRAYPGVVKYLIVFGTETSALEMQH